jgi:hypothetical protein
MSRQYIPACSDPSVAGEFGYYHWKRGPRAIRSERSRTKCLKSPACRNRSRFSDSHGSAHLSNGMAVACRTRCAKRWSACITFGGRLPAPVEEEKYRQQGSAGHQSLQQEIRAQLIHQLTPHPQTAHHFSLHSRPFLASFSSDMQMGVAAGCAHKVSVKA